MSAPLSARWNSSWFRTSSSARPASSPTSCSPLVRVWRDALEQPDDEFDLHLNNGRLLEHFHEGNLTYRSPGIKEKTPDTFVEVSPELAEERGIQSGSLVQLTSRRGRLRVRAVVTDRVHNGELYMPMNSAENPVNVLTGSHTDTVTHT